MNEPTSTGGKYPSALEHFASQLIDLLEDIADDAMVAQAEMMVLQAEGQQIPSELFRLSHVDTVDLLRKREELISYR